MGTNILAIMLLVLVGYSSSAQYQQKCNIQYKRKTDGTWSDNYAVNISFATGYELSTANPYSLSYDPYKDYAFVSWSNGTMGLTIATPLQCGLNADRNCIQSHPEIYANDKEGRVWRIYTEEVFSLSANDISDAHTSNKYEESATVVYTNGICDYIILEDTRGYIVAEWYHGYVPANMDKIYGSFNRYGKREFHCRNREVTLWVDDYMLSQDEAIKSIANHCK